MVKDLDTMRVPAVAYLSSRYRKHFQDIEKRAVYPALVQRIGKNSSEKSNYLNHADLGVALENLKNLKKSLISKRLWAIGSEGPQSLARTLLQVCPYLVR